MRPAPQGRAYRERRHFCHVTILVSSDLPSDEAKSDGKSKASTPAVSKRAKRGGAVAAPRAKRVTSKSEAVESSETKSGATKEAKGAKKASKAGSKLSKALRRKKTDE